MFLPLFLLIVGKSERIYSTGFQHFKTEKTAAKTGFSLKSAHASGCFNAAKFPFFFAFQQ